MNKDQIGRNLLDVIKRYSSFPGLFKSNIESKHTSVLKQLENGDLTDPEELNVYFNVAKDEEEGPKVITIRGINQLESLDYHIQACAFDLLFHHYSYLKNSTSMLRKCYKCLTASKKLYIVLLWNVCTVGIQK